MYVTPAHLPPQSLFSLNHQTGELRLAVDLDYDNEDDRDHIITLIAEVTAGSLHSLH